ncbi:MAG: hypothetical protein ACYDCO_08390 [Armatimonadota bacterium]
MTSGKSSPHCETTGQSSLIPPAPDASALVPGIALPYGELQHAVTWLALVRTLHTAGIFNILQGIMLLSVPMLIFYFIMRIGVAFKPNLLPHSLLAMLFVIGLLGIILFVLGIVFLANQSPASLMLLAVSGHWDFYRRYRQLGPYLIHAPRPAMLQEATELLQRISSGNIKAASDLIHFNSAGRWRGLLQDDLAILVRYPLHANRFSIEDVRFLSPAEFSLTPLKQTVAVIPFGRWLVVSCRIDDLQINGIISPEYFERYQAWAQRHDTASGTDLESNALLEDNKAG